MMSPRPMGEDRSSPPHFRHTPLQIIHIIGNFLRIWSVYSTYQYFCQSGASVVLFFFSCLVPSSILFLALQKPWKGRSLSNQQIVPSIINGAITALYFLFWGKGLKICGPVRLKRPIESEAKCALVTILAEYSGAVLGVLSAALYGQRGHVWKKVGGLIVMLASFYLLSQGWAMETYFPISFKDDLKTDDQTTVVLGMKGMTIPILAGILSAFRRVIARRLSLKNQLKRRLHAISITSATCFLFPVAMWDFIIGSTSDASASLPFSAWPFFSTVLFGVILIFYVDTLAEERLHMVFSSPRHLMVAGGCIIIMEIIYKMDFSLPGFVLCSSILGFGIYQATSLERSKKGSFLSSDTSNGILEEQTLPT